MNTFTWFKIPWYTRNMNEDIFKIYIEQLREGREEAINETLNPSFLDVQDLVFDKPVELEGTAFLAEHELVFHWDIRTEVILSCSICNEPVRVPIHIQNFYYSEPLKEIKAGIYNFKDLLRETILLEVPAFAECNDGKCPKRQEFQKYLKESSDQPSDEEGYQPFADLDWK